jgi:hypothetical protein
MNHGRMSASDPKRTLVGRARVCLSLEAPTKLDGFMKQVLFALTACFIALTASWPTRANTINLTCTFLDQVFIVPVNFTNNTVNKKPATISAKDIEWHSYSIINGPDAPVALNHIDRTNGLYTSSYTRDGGNQVTIAQCKLNGSMKF